MRSVEFHPEAQDEFISAAQFYERQAEGPGLDFVRTVQQAYERLLEAPASGPPFGRWLRRLLVPKFPYGLLYRVEPNASTSSRSCTFTDVRVTDGHGSEALLPTSAAAQTAGSHSLTAAARRERYTHKARRRGASER